MVRAEGSVYRCRCAIGQTIGDGGKPWGGLSALWHICADDLGRWPRLVWAAPLALRRWLGCLRGRRPCAGRCEAFGLKGEDTIRSTQRAGRKMWVMTSVLTLGYSRMSLRDRTTRAKGARRLTKRSLGVRRQSPAACTDLRWRVPDSRPKFQARCRSAIHPGGMKEGSRRSKRSETPGPTALRACTPKGCQSGSTVFWHPFGVPGSSPLADRGSQLRRDPRLPSGNPPGCGERPNPASYRPSR